MIDYPSIFCTIVYPICLTLSYFVSGGGEWLRLWLTAYSVFLLCGKIFGDWLVSSEWLKNKANELNANSSRRQ